jgi:hypothetical protein
MVKKTDKINNSQPIDLPFDFVQHYFAKKRKNQLLALGGLILLLASIVTAIAVPLLFPALFVIGFIAIPWIAFSVTLIPTFGLMYFILVYQHLFKYPSINLKTDSIKIASNQEGQNFKRYMIFKNIKNDQAITFSVNTQKDSIKDQLKLFYGVPVDACLLLDNMIYEIDKEIKDLGSKRSELRFKLQNDILPKNKNEIRRITQKLESVTIKIKKHEHLIALLRKANAPINEKKYMVQYSRTSINNLYSVLIQNKNLKSVQKMNEAILEIEKTKTYFKSLGKPIGNEVIQQIDFLTHRMLCASIEDTPKAFLAEDPNCYDVYFKYIPKEMTEYFYRLLDNKEFNQHALKILNDRLIEHPDSTDPINQNIHYVLATHFYLQFKDNKTEANTKQACLHALKLDSSNESNADFKKAVIESAFFFQNSPDTNLISEEVQSLLLHSHENPDAYEAIKKCMADNIDIPKPNALQFSKSQSNLEIIDASKPNTPSAPKLK